MKILRLGDTVDGNQYDGILGFLSILCIILKRSPRDFDLYFMANVMNKMSFRHTWQYL